MLDGGHGVSGLGVGTVGCCLESRYGVDEGGGWGLRWERRVEWGHVGGFEGEVDRRGYWNEGNGDGW